MEQRRSELQAVAHEPTLLINRTTARKGELQHAIGFLGELTSPCETPGDRAEVAFALADLVANTEAVRMTRRPSTRSKSPTMSSAGGLFGCVG